MLLIRGLFSLPLSHFLSAASPINSVAVESRVCLSSAPSFAQAANEFPLPCPGLL